MSRKTSTFVAASLLLGAAVSVIAAHRAPDARALFVEAADRAALRFVHDNGATGQYYMPEMMGSGVAVFDYDNDGDLDIFFVQSQALEPRGSAPRGGEPRLPGHRLFRNDGVVDGIPHFTDVTERAGVGARTVGMGATVGDVDGDGWLDLYVTAFGSNTLYRNRGDGTFVDVTAQAGVDDPRWSTSAAFLDYDRDGDLDLFVVNYVAFTVAGNKACTDHSGARDYCPPRAYPPVPARLFRNDGGLRFTDVTAPSRVASAFGAGLGVAVGDLDGDGWLDVYVANDATPNDLWMNRRDGTFEDRGLISGTSLSGGGRPEGSMGIALGDADDDGDEDLFVTNIVGETHAMYVNDGHGNFDDDRARAGLAGPTSGMTGFGTNWLDYDHDGRLDLFLTSGAVNILESQRGQPLPYFQRSQLFHNDGGGRFREVSAEAGSIFERLGIGRGAAFGDLDNDGDVDIVVTNNDGPAWLLLNELLRPGEGAGTDRHWIEIALRAPGGNRFGIGARVGIERQGQPTLWRRARTDGSYLTGNDPRVHVGLGAQPAITRVIVEWVDGSPEAFTDVAADRVVTLGRGRGTLLK